MVLAPAPTAATPLLLTLCAPRRRRSAHRPRAAPAPACLPPHPLPFAGKVHGSLARAGKVRGQCPKVPKQEKPKKPTGRAMQRLKYNRRFVNVVVGLGKKRGPNSNNPA